MPDKQQIATFRWIFLVLACSSAAAHLLGLYLGNSIILWTTRGITMPLIVAALVGFKAATRCYCPLIAAGLLISLPGDLFMADESKWFLHGLASFLIAHLFYIVAFSLNRPAPGTDALSAIPFAIFAVVALASVAGGVGDLFIPTLVYTIIISAMGWRAAARYIARKRDLSGLLALIGAVAFIASDSMIAWNNFREPFEWKKPAVMTTYFGAQIIFALSVLLDRHLSQQPAAEQE